MTHLDLCSGAGGFSIALERAGFKTTHFSEVNANAIKLLKRHWPNIPNLGDIRGFLEWPEFKPTIITCGDPCPKHSKARSNGDSKSPDLSGYFLAVVGRFRPQWVVRENVPSPTVKHVSTALEAIGYSTVIIRTDAATFTAQSRARDFIVGCYKASRGMLRQTFQNSTDVTRVDAPINSPREVAPCLTTNGKRYDSRDCYVYESRGLRILDSDERQRLSGFPEGFASEFSEAAQTKFYGNAVVPPVVFEIAKSIAASLTSFSK